MKIFTIVALLMAFGFLFTDAYAQTAENIDAENRAVAESKVRLTPGQQARVQSEALMSEDEKAANRAGEQEFAGLSFGVGISLTFDTGAHARVKSASIVDGIVRVDNEDDKIARIMLESHYFFTPEGRFLKLSSMPPGKWGLGPFVAIQPGTEEFIEAVAVGVMVGFRRPDESGSSWNVGIGYITDPNVQVLGDGFVENQPPPGNETEIRFKEISQDGVVLLFSFTF